MWWSHLRLLCAGERPFKCESCNYLAANQHEVTRHARQVHNGPKPLSCPYCDYKTADRSNYKKHVELHLNPRQFLCPLCKYAASKKCNLQYHIKSRHAGCSVAMDISKVKLRVKKAGPQGAEDKSRDHKPSSTPEDFDLDGDNRDKGVNNPINLSIRRSGRPGLSQSGQSDTPDKICPPPDRQKLVKGKEQEKRITTRQKVKRAQEKSPEDQIQPGPTASKTMDTKTKTKVKKLQLEKTTVQSPREEPGQAHKPEQRQSEDKRPAKDKDKQSGETSRRKKKGLNKSRRSEKASRHTDHSQHHADGLQQTPDRRAAKEKAPKRKAAEALDLTQAPPDRPPKTRRTKGAKKPNPEEAGRTGDLRSSGSTKQKKSKMVPVKGHNLSIIRTSVVSGPEPLKAKDVSSRKGSPRPSEDRPPSVSPQGVDTPLTQVCDQNAAAAPQASGPPEPEPATPAGPAEKTEDGSEDAPPPSAQTKAPDPEDDEGIHSSHEGVSDISDSASEGSEDSGLNSNGTGSGQLANDPETPTDDRATPTALKTHLCIFCDRSFALEAAYRRHLSRHLVNVYYMDHTASVP